MNNWKYLDIVKYPPDSKTVFLHHHEKHWSKNQLASKNFGLQSNSNILYFYIPFLKVHSNSIQNISWKFPLERKIEKWWNLGDLISYGYQDFLKTDVFMVLLKCIKKLEKHRITFIKTYLIEILITLYFNSKTLMSSKEQKRFAHPSTNFSGSSTYYHPRLFAHHQDSLPAAVYFIFLMQL